MPKPHVTRDARRAAGLCIDCGEKPPTESAQRCAGCNDKEADRMAARRERCAAEGRCVICGCAGGTAAVNKCLPCWFKQQTNNTDLARDEWTLLQAMWEAQGGRCAYTGWKLTPGVDASLDHRTPVAQGGAGTIDNLCWAHISANEMKRALTVGQFVGLAEVVARHCAGQGDPDVAENGIPVVRGRRKRAARGE